MELQKGFMVPASEATTVTRIKAYLEQAGYKRASDSPICYKRGSILGSFTSFSPRSWQAEVNITTQPRAENETEVSVCLKVNTTGQWVTEKERDFWDTEFNSLEVAIHSGQMDDGGAAQASRTAALTGLKAAAVFTLVLFIVGVPVAILTVTLTGDTSLTYVGLIAGFAAGYAVLRCSWGVGRS